MDRWHLISGEYAPQFGGVADYSALLAAGLARNGVDVHVWTSGDAGVDSAEGVSVHRTSGRWSPTDLRRLDEELDRFAAPRRLLVQYAPNVWGYKGLNFGFCRWLVQRRTRGDDVRVMFHEVAYPLEWPDKPTRWLLALGQRYMARTLMDSCSAVYFSIPAWWTLLHSLNRKLPLSFAWLPVPSNVPVVQDPDQVAELRRTLAPRGESVIGSFGTFGRLIVPLLTGAVRRLIESRDDRVLLLLGRGSDRFAAELTTSRPDLAGRIVARGELAPAGISLHLQACDLLIQPYPDGLSSRRGSLMAGLAHGLATVSNLGHLSEPIWSDTGCVALAARPDPALIARTAEEVLASPKTRETLGMTARALYDGFFAIERTLEQLQASSVIQEQDQLEASCG
jgi:glycosyltransferase involved in cell wall biosynthesis